MICAYHILRRMNLLHAYQLVPIRASLFRKLVSLVTTGAYCFGRPSCTCPSHPPVFSLLPLRLLHFEIQVLFRRVAIVFSSSRTCFAIGATFFFLPSTRFIFQYTRSFVCRQLEIGLHILGCFHWGLWSKILV